MPKHRAHLQAGLTRSTRKFISRSMLVRLNVVFPLFCINLVSGPGKANTAVIHAGHAQPSSSYLPPWLPGTLQTARDPHSFACAVIPIIQMEM